MINHDEVLTRVTESTLSIFIVFGGVVPYIPQYLEIKRLKNSDGFSPYVCLTLIVANLLRIGFWFGQPFPVPLLVQAILMVFTMMFMVHVSVKYRQKSTPLDGGQRLFSDLNWTYFWAWSDFTSYVQFVALFAVVICVPCVSFSHHQRFVQTTGFVALLTESTLALPQVWRNYRQSSTAGMSLKMVLMWSVGDLFKTVYFLLSKAPVQFLVCGIVQMLLDAAVLLQYIYYRHRPHREAKLHLLG